VDKGRVEAFSDGVLAIIITIMVLQFQAPKSIEVSALIPLIPKFLSYILSYIIIGIYWTNHHHLWQAVEEVNGSILWANLHLLFWLSLIPFVTSWIGENQLSSIPVALYGLVLWFTAVAYYILVHTLITHHNQDSLLAKAVGESKKDIRSIIIYTAAVLLSFVSPLLATLLYVAVALMWFMPDRRIEKVVENNSK
jgi:uncharacterized membrane protein